MLQSIRQFLVITRFSCLERLGSPVVLLLALTTTIGTLILPLFQFQHFSEDGRLARDCGLAAIFTIGLFLIIGSVTDIYRSLTTGTAAIALSKPLTRRVWFCGHLCGYGLLLVWYLLTSSAAVLTAEACSPQYHAAGGYADLKMILLALLFPIIALLLGALNNRFRHGRFTLTVTLSLPILMWITPLLQCHIHWGTLTILPILALFLLQVLTFAGALTTFCPPGMTVCLTLLGTLLALWIGPGSAYLPLDLLANGGAIPAHIGWLLVPQTILGILLFGWLGVTVLSRKESV